LIRYCVNKICNLLNASNMDRVHGCGVISDSDVDFGRVLQPVNDVCESEPSERGSAERLTHPSECRAA